MTPIEGRRKTIYGTGGMQMLDIQNREQRPWNRNDPYTGQGADVLPWIEKYTEGEFYLSDYTVGFSNPRDLLMFKLAFKR